MKLNIQMPSFFLPLLFHFQRVQYASYALLRCDEYRSNFVPVVELFSEHFVPFAVVSSKRVGIAGIRNLHPPDLKHDELDHRATVPCWSSLFFFRHEPVSNGRRILVKSRLKLATIDGSELKLGWNVRLVGIRSRIFSNLESRAWSKFRESNFLRRSWKTSGSLVHKSVRSNPWLGSEENSKVWTKFKTLSINFFKCLPPIYGGSLILFVHFNDLQTYIDRVPYFH